MEGGWGGGGGQEGGRREVRALDSFRILSCQVQFST